LPATASRCSAGSTGRRAPSSATNASGRERISEYREKQPPRGFDYLHLAIDDHSRFAYVEVHPDERADTCAGFMVRAIGHFAELGVAVERVMSRQRLQLRTGERIPSLDRLGEVLAGDANRPRERNPK
jgi:hypothetical protein